MVFFEALEKMESKRFIMIDMLHETYYVKPCFEHKTPKNKKHVTVELPLFCSHLNLCIIVKCGAKLPSCYVIYCVKN